MEWSDRVEAVFRVFARQHEDTSVQFEELKLVLATFADAADVQIEFGELSEYFLPVQAEDIERSRARGFLLTEFEGRVCYVIRQLPMTFLGDVDAAFCTTLVEAFEGKFAMVRYVREALTEIVAV